MPAKKKLEKRKGDVDKIAKGRSSEGRSKKDEEVDQAEKVEDSCRVEEDEWCDEDSQDSQAGPFIRPGNRRFRRTGEERERLARVKARAILRVLDELDVEADDRKMVLPKVELVARMNTVYTDELRRAEASDPNKARYVRDSMLACVVDSLEEKG